MLELGTELYIKNSFIEWYIHRFHRLVERQRRTGIIQTTRLVHHMLIKSRGDLLRCTIAHPPTSLQSRNGTLRTASPTQDG